VGDKTGIEWTDATWNPIRGCTRVSEGCRNCYAEAVAGRFCSPGQPYAGLAQVVTGIPRLNGGVRSEARWTGKIRFVPEHLEDPFRWKRPRRIFVNSMSDLFHPDVTDQNILAILAVMYAAKRHQFQVLTKRPERMKDFLLREQFKVGAVNFVMPENPAPNIWWGVSVEDQATADYRIPFLLQTPAAIRWVSYEPALGSVDFDIAAWLSSLDWIVCGGESGPNARPMHPAWARAVRDQCVEAGVPFLFKQWGEWFPVDKNLPNGWQGPKVYNFGDQWMLKQGKKRAGRLLDGRTWDQYPK